MDTQTKTLHPALASSVDPTKIAATITGFLTGISGIVMLVASLYHFPLAPSAYDNFVHEMAGGVSAIVTAGGFLYMIFGLLRKLVLKLFPKKQ